MTENNAREALTKIVGQHEPDVTSYDAYDLWGCGCGWEAVRNGTEWEQYDAHQADAILAAGWTPPTVKPSVEDVARRHSRVGMDGTCICGAEGIGFVLGYGEHLVAEVLALLPGRTEAEVKAEAWDEGYRNGYRDRRREASYEPGTNPYRKKETPDE